MLMHMCRACLIFFALECSLRLIMRMQMMHGQNQCYALTSITASSKMYHR